MCDSLQPRGLQPTRFLYPWDSPGKNTAVVCYFLSRGSPWLRNQTHSSCTAGTLYHWATWEAQGMLHPCTFPNNPSEESEEGWIIDRNIVSASSLGESVEQVVSEATDHPPPWVSCTGSSSWWGWPHSVNLGIRATWVCILIPQSETIRPRKKASSSWTFRSSPCKLLQMTKTAFEKTKWDQPTSLYETSRRGGIISSTSLPLTEAKLQEKVCPKWKSLSPNVRTWNQATSIAPVTTKPKRGAGIGETNPIFTYILTYSPNLKIWLLSNKYFLFNQNSLKLSKGPPINMF